MTQLGKLVAKMRGDFNKVVGMVGVAGDRRDGDILAMGALAASVFDHLVLREEHGLRGRAPGEAAQLLRQGAVNAGCPPSGSLLSMRWLRLSKHVCNWQIPKDLVVLLADGIEKVWQQIIRFKPGAAVRQATRHVVESKLKSV